MPNAALEQDLVEQVVAAVRANPKYRQIDAGFVRRVAAQELPKRRDWKEAVKATRNKLHQVGGAYQQQGMAYEEWLAGLREIDLALNKAAFQEQCRAILARHASTRERLPTLDHFYRETLASLAPVRSVLDLACGLNPLAIPWMPLAAEAEYFACDIYLDQVEFLNAFFARCGVRGRAEICDLTQAAPARQAQVALLLKTLPCLEQVDASIGPRLLDQVQAEHLLVSFPAHSLGGRSKGMRETYAARFEELLAGRTWSYQVFQFPGEVAFLVSKKIVD